MGRSILPPLISDKIATTWTSLNQLWQLYAFFILLFIVSLWVHHLCVCVCVCVFVFFFVGMSLFNQESNRKEMAHFNDWEEFNKETVLKNMDKVKGSKTGW